MGEAEGSVRYYCTAGGGMETFLLDEVKRKLEATEVEHIPGRVFFRCRAALQELMRLKSAERLFLLLRKAPPTSLPKNPAKAASMIQQRIVGNPDVWSQALSTWAALRAGLNSSWGRGQKRKREEEEGKNEENGRKESVEKEDSCGLGQNRPTFRVSCRCSGAVARCCNSQNLSRIIGVAISRQLGWKTDLREPNLEVNVYMSDDHCVLGIPLLRHPLASRSYMKHTGLRSTIAWAMTSVCPIQEASVILDPMCGVGTILLEAAQECPNAVFIGMDSEEAQLQKAAENVEAAGQVSRMLLVQSSCMDIPLPTGSVDAVLCDVPFGRKFSCSTDMTTALPRILAEMERVLREGGYLVLLLSLQLSAQIKKLVKSNTLNPESRAAGRDDESPDRTHDVNTHSSETDEDRETERLKLSSLLLQNTHRVSLGSTDAIIHTYTKTHTLTH
ncbi:THUMP domain-containing protein 2 [Colossoma macropomum]|uniref:THUMP domain-containing protein 2 n=1 Tax=Colossoma macropomum TaxID=42526 RepID=UPI001864747A|nr:THUMP domain-containing protein 2 [Colossoma macropomum]